MFPQKPDEKKTMEKPIDFDLIRNARFPEGALGTQMIEGMNRSHARLTEWGFSHISEFGQTVLDVGCGGGAALKKLAERFPNAQLFGCDVSPLAIQSAEELNAENVSAGKMSFHCGGVSKLPFPNGFFDSVFSVESLYFWPDPEKDLAEILRVLKPGGRFMTVLEMVGGSMSERHAEIARRLEMFCPAPEELRELLTRSGFSVTALTHDTQNGWLCGVGEKRA